MDFAETEEHRALRAAVAEIAKNFGPRYYAERAAERRPCAELWTGARRGRVHRREHPRGSTAVAAEG